MEYVRLSKSRGFKYACNSHLYSQYSKKTGVMYLKCDTADCKGTAQIDQGLLIPRRPIYCQNPLLADSITCKFIQPFKTRGLTHWCTFWGLHHLNLIFSNILFLKKYVKIRAKIGNFKLKWWNMIVEVYQKVWNRCTSKFNTMSRALNSVILYNMMTSQ